MPKLQHAHFVFLAALVFGKLSSFHAAAFAADEPKANETQTENAKELKKLTGTWIPIAVERKGESLPAEVPQMKFVIQGKKMTLVFGDNTEAKSVFQEIAIDPLKNPKQIDLSGEVDGKLQVVQGIYKLEGDKLTICTDDHEKQRPTQFSNPNKPTFSTLTLKRQ